MCLCSNLPCNCYASCFHCGEHTDHQTISLALRRAPTAHEKRQGRRARYGVPAQVCGPCMEVA